MTDELMALAERVEAIDPTTDCDWTGIHSLNEAICAANTPPDGVRTVIPPDYLRSLDAAMTLVPEDLRVMLMQQPCGKLWECGLLTLEGDDRDISIIRAATPALALTAAALRARATKEPKA